MGLKRKVIPHWNWNQSLGNCLLCTTAPVQRRDAKVRQMNKQTNENCRNYLHVGYVGQEESNSILELQIMRLGHCLLTPQLQCREEGLTWDKWTNKQTNENIRNAQGYVGPEESNSILEWQDTSLSHCLLHTIAPVQRRAAKVRQMNKQTNKWIQIVDIISGCVGHEGQAVPHRSGDQRLGHRMLRILAPMQKRGANVRQGDKDLLQRWRHICINKHTKKQQQECIWNIRD